jgi:hypothetical protein
MVVRKLMMMTIDSRAAHLHLLEAVIRETPPPSESHVPADNDPESWLAVPRPVSSLSFQSVLPIYYSAQLNPTVSHASSYL